jgi:hypothetical protein
MDFFALTLPPASMVAIIFAVAFLLIGIPVHLCRGSAARDAWGTLAGLFAGLLYMALILSVYPNVHGGGQQAVTKVSVEHEADTKRLGVTWVALPAFSLMPQAFGHGHAVECGAGHPGWNMDYHAGPR